MHLDTLAELFERVTQNSDRKNLSGCIKFKGASRNGYGSITKSISGKTTVYFTHRIVKMYTLKNINIGPCSHLCGVKLCCNPEHIVIESNRVNNLRKTCHANNFCYGHELLNGERLTNCIVLVSELGTNL